MLKLGIDDAGRGPVIGPMVLSGVLIDEKAEREFKRLGVKDSKQLSEKRREFLANTIREKAETFEVIIIHPNDIDKKNKEGINLNEVEAIATARIINKINKGYKKIKVLVDCPSTSTVKWQESVTKKIKESSTIELSCEHKADRNHICVSAASILAKSTREKEMFKLKKKFGNDIGSGYTSDSLTTKFLKKNIKKYNNKGIFRKSWSTWKNTLSEQEQKKLSEF
tara:strand:- start:660 stop:1331 length:672 start_codon:yes stop_codon:yes gene_type:complete